LWTEVDAIHWFCICVEGMMLSGFVKGQEADLVVINSWNRFCFTGGYVEASVSLPGKNNVYGLWPAIWSLGNLGRAGYGGTLDGVWPYSYDTCDVGTLHNQTLNGETLFLTCPMLLQVRHHADGGMARKNRKQ
jgi:hypothetical protein